MDSTSRIDRAHKLYKNGRHDDALELYTQALAIANTKPQMIALHSNRAACYLKLHNFKKAAEECTSVLELDLQHTGALMLRAQTLVTLKDYQSALFDVNRLIELNPKSYVYQNLQARLKTQQSLTPIPESEEEELYFEERATSKMESKKIQQAGISSKATSTWVLKPKSSDVSSKSQSWQAISAPKGHSGLDYCRWDRVQGDSSEEEDDDEKEEEHLPQYKFCVRTVGVRPFK